MVSIDKLRTFPLGPVQFGEDYGNPPTEQMVIAVLATILRVPAVQDSCSDPSTAGSARAA